MIVVVASAIIRKEEKFLFVKETKPSALDKWGLPGGKLEEGESIIDCVCREIKEETGYEVLDRKIFHVINKPKTHEGHSVLKFVFLCTVPSRPTFPAELECKFLSIDDIRDLESKSLIRGKEVLRLLEDNLDNRTADLLQIMN